MRWNVGTEFLMNGLRTGDSRIKKAQLLSQREVVTPPPKYLAQELAVKFESGDFNIKILMLPVAHPELNPIEHVCEFFKRTVASQNFTHNLKEVERLTKMHITSFKGPHGSGPNRMFGKFVRNTIEEEERYRRLAAEMDVEEDRNRDNDGNKETGPKREVRRRAMTAVTLTTTITTVKTMSVKSTMSSCCSTLASINILRFRLNKTKCL
jgi:hypothetical protein